MVFEHNFNQYPELTNTQLEEMQFESPHKQITEDFDAVVIKVHDGDTITLQTSFRDFTFPLRLLDIDAPEMNAGGEVARDWLIGRILGAAVKILIDPGNRVDKYGRLLGRVLHQGLDIGTEELNMGLAIPFSQRGERTFPVLGKMFSLKQWF